MATTVVPWVNSCGAMPRGRSPQRGSPPARRSTSRKDGPGSSSARKVGSVIEPEATGWLLPCRPGSRYALAEIADGCVEQPDVVAEQSQALVAPATEDAADRPCVVAVVEVQARGPLGPLAADGAAPALRLEQPVEPVGRDAERPPVVGVPLRPLALGTGVVDAMILVDTFRVGLLPRLDARDLAVAIRRVPRSAPRCCAGLALG